MCRMVYLGASKPLRLVPWDEAKPGFHVDELLPKYRDAVGAQLGMPFLYYVGAHEGCGCGFQYGEYPESRSENPDSGPMGEALTSFRAYLRTELRGVDAIQVLACWADDEGKEPTHRRSLTPEDLLRDDFYFLDGESSVFSAADG